MEEQIEIIEDAETKSVEEHLNTEDEIKFSKEDWIHMWEVLHTPISRNEKKVGRNEVCPYCDSGKKFKNCECYKTHKVDWIQKPVFGRPTYGDR